MLFRMDRDQAGYRGTQQGDPGNPHDAPFDFLGEDDREIAHWGKKLAIKWKYSEKKDPKEDKSGPKKVLKLVE